MKELKALVNFVNGHTLEYNQEAKDRFKQMGIAAMKKLGKKLQLREFDASFNAGGIAVAGDLHLMGMFNDNVGVYFSISKGWTSSGEIQCLYRTIKHMKDYTGGSNNWMNGAEFSSIEKVMSNVYRICRVTKEELGLLPKLPQKKTVTLAQLRKVSTKEELEALGIGRVIADFGNRGGGVGFNSHDVANHFYLDETLLPGKVGAACNYLGGGIRGAIFGGTFSNQITSRKAELLQELINACVRVYQNSEDESGLNDLEDEQGETNWEAKATKDARAHGTTSAY